MRFGGLFSGGLFFLCGGEAYYRNFTILFLGIGVLVVFSFFVERHNYLVIVVFCCGSILS